MKRSGAHPVHPSVASRRARARERMYRRTGYGLKILIGIGVVVAIGTAAHQDWTVTALFAAWAGFNLALLKLSQVLWERVAE